MEIPEKEPLKINIGDTIKWKRVDLTANYPASAGWSLKYVLISNVSGSGKIELTASQDGTTDQFLIEKNATQSAAWTAGRYNWAAYVSKDSERYRVDYGVIDLLPNLEAQTAGTDNRTHNRKMLEAIRALLEGRAVSDVQSYQINSRSLTKLTIKELLHWESVYAARVQAEENLLRAEKGLSNSNVVKVTFK